MSPETDPGTAGLAAEVRELLGTALGRTLAPGEEPQRAESEDWNSLIHIELVFLLEERYDIRLDDAEILQLNSPAAIVAVVSAKGAVGSR